jgi:hypothetical protein
MTHRNLARHGLMMSPLIAGKLVDQMPIDKQVSPERWRRERRH